MLTNFLIRLFPKLYFCADNINIDAGSTLTVATDDISGVHYQVVKVAHGADGTATPVSAAAALPVYINSATLGTVTISGNVNIATATLGTVTITGTTVITSGNINVSSATLGTVTVAVASITGGTVTVYGTGTAGTSSTGVITVQGIANGTAVPISSASGFNVNVATATLGTVTISGNVNVATATLGTVTITGTTVVTSGNINVSSATLGTVTITGTTVVTSGNINVSSATLGTVTITGSVTNSVSTIPIVGRTLTGQSGSLTATNGAISITPTNRIKVYAFSLTTTCPTEVIGVFNSGGVANGLELWRATLMAPAGASAGANLAVAPPNFLFASRTGTAVSLSLNTAVLVHWSISYFEEV